MKHPLLCFAAWALAAASVSAAGREPVLPAGGIAIGYREASAPFSFLDASHRPAGFTLDLCNHVVEAIRTSLSLATLKVNYVPMSSSDRVDKS